MGTSSSAALKRKPQYHEPEPLPAKVTKKCSNKLTQKSQEGGKQATQTAINTSTNISTTRAILLISTLGFLPAQATTRATPMRDNVHSHTVHMAMMVNDDTDIVIKGGDHRRGKKNVAA